MKKILFMTGIMLFLILSNCFSQNLPRDRMRVYDDFSDFCIEHTERYVDVWISREKGYYNEKNENKRRQFAQEIWARFNSAWEKSRSDFRDKVYNAPQFKNDIKSLLEQLNNTENGVGILNDWNTLLSENGYSQEGYNNIERFGYYMLFLINSCMFLDQEFSNNNITDSIIEKVKKNFVELGF
ncbi:hypothetical protein FACS1894110_26760 [Spirochaetia bacterium]|nr:hypothetical protein FACS1894110_26760 [Spirochaetia bacterium]